MIYMCLDILFQIDDEIQDMVYKADQAPPAVCPLGSWHVTYLKINQIYLKEWCVSRNDLKYNWPWFNIVFESEMGMCLLIRMLNLNVCIYLLLKDLVFDIIMILWSLSPAANRKNCKGILCDMPSEASVTCLLNENLFVFWYTFTSLRVSRHYLIHNVLLRNH